MDIEKDEIEGIVAKLGERIRGGFDDMGGYVQGYEFPLQGPADQLVVVDDKDFRKKMKGHIFLWKQIKYHLKNQTVQEKFLLLSVSCEYVLN